MRNNKKERATKLLAAKKDIKAGLVLKRNKMTRACALLALKNGADPKLYLAHSNAHIRIEAALRAKAFATDNEVVSFAGIEQNETIAERASKALFPNDVKRLEATFKALGNLFKLGEKHASVVKKEQEEALKKAEEAALAELTKKEEVQCEETQSSS